MLSQYATKPRGPNLDDKRRLRKLYGKQALVSNLRDLPEKFILVIGAVGSGKTFSALAGYVLFSVRYSGANFAIMAQTMAKVKMQLEPELHRICNEAGIHFRRRGSKYGDWYEVGENLFLPFSFNNREALPKLQGHDLTGAFIDEVVNVPQYFLQEVDNRLRQLPGAKCVMTANPGGGRHWFKKEWVDKSAEKSLYEFKLFHSDNPTLDAEFVRSVNATSEGGFYERRVLGQWAGLSGLVYPNYRPAVEAPNEAEALQWYLSIDPAESGTTHALLIGRFVDEFWVYDEWRHEGKIYGQITQEEMAKRIRNWVGDKTIAGIVCDSAAPNMALALANTFGIGVNKVGLNKSVLKGINHTQAWLSHGWIRMSTNVPHTLNELSTYSWDTHASERGEDKPVKSEDHAMDALRYFVMAYWSEFYDDAA